MDEFIYIVGRDSLDGVTIEAAYNNEGLARRLFYEIRNEMILEMKRDLYQADMIEKNERASQILISQMNQLKLCVPDHIPRHVSDHPYIKKMKVHG